MDRRDLLKLFAVGGTAGVLALGGNSLRRAIASEGGSSWGYVGETGPEHWGDLSATYSTCRTGLDQSPIDLHDAIRADLAAVAINYQPLPLNIFNSGHSIQINAAPGNRLQLDNEEFELLQFHFHHPSEHTLDGQSFPLEVHFVHQNAKGELAVLGVFLQEGAENMTLRPVWEAMPRQKTEPETITGIEIDVNRLFPSDRSIYRYFGSLTTPPCSETVKWVVFQEPIEVSPAQIAVFQDIFPLNARPVQPLSRRFLLRSR